MSAAGSDGAVRQPGLLTLETDQAGRLTAWPASAGALLGWTGEEALGRVLADWLVDATGRPLGPGFAPADIAGISAKDGSVIAFSAETIEVAPSTVRVLIVTSGATAAGPSADRLGRLQRIAAALSGLLDAGQVATVVIEEIGPEVGATTLLWLATDDGRTLELVQPDRHPPATGFTRIPIDSELPGAVAARTRAPVYVSSGTQRDEMFPALSTIEGQRAFAALPLLSRDGTAGVLAVGYADEHDFDEGERRFLSAVADLAAGALDRARLRDDEQRGTERLRFLAEASAVLAGSLDYEVTLQRVVDLIVPRVAEMATIHLYDDDGELRRVALKHEDETTGRDLLTYVEAHENEARSRQLAAAAARGDPLLVPDTSRVIAQQAAVDAEHARLLQNLNITSGILEPLVARGTTLGVLSFLRVGDRPPFGPDEEALAAELARRAAVAVDNARLHAERVEVATLLQASLLPPALPDIPGIELSASYRPAGEGIVVGGDFYDVFPLPDDRWAFVIGDVTGTGPAAAALTAQVRYTARAIAGLGADAARVVEAVNDALVGGMDTERFCTIVFATATVTSDGVELDIVNAGHPYPVLVGADGTARLVELAGTLLAVVPGVSYESHRMTLSPGEVLLFYTDGVVEGRSDARDVDGQYAFFDESGLLAAAQGPPGRSPAQIVAAVEAALQGFAGHRFADDVAILAVGSPADVM
jgi:serine phosphatase RsbU (regulator of sigma subunit)